MKRRRPSGLLLVSERKAAKCLGISRKKLKRLRQMCSECGDHADLPWFRCEEGCPFYDRLEEYKRAQQA